MKRYLFALVVILAISGCSKFPFSDYIIDWAPVNFYIKVVDASGNDLLDPSNEKSWIIGTTLDFMNKKDTVDMACIENIHQTKVYLPYFSGVKLMKNPFSPFDGYVLKFGEFDGADSYDKEQLTINWPDGTSNTITYSREFNVWQTEVRSEELRVDGEKCSSPVTIVKKR